MPSRSPAGRTDRRGLARCEGARGDSQPPSNGFDVGPVFVHAYGLAYVVGILAAVALVKRRWPGDPAHHVLGLRLNLFVAAALFAVGVAWFVRTQRIRARRGGGVLLVTGALATAGLTGCGHDQAPAAVGHGW